MDSMLPGLGQPTAASPPVPPGRPPQPAVGTKPSAFSQLAGQGSGGPQPAAKPGMLGGMAQAKPEQLQQLASQPPPSLTPPKPQPAPPSVTPSAAPPSGATVPGKGSGGPLAAAAPVPGGQPQLPGLPSALPPEGGSPPAAMPETPSPQPPGLLEQLFPKAPEPGMGNPAAKPSFTPGQEPGMMDKVLNWAPDAMGLDSKEMHPVIKGIMSIGGPALLLMLLTKLFGGRGKEASLADYTAAEQAHAGDLLAHVFTIKQADPSAGVPVGVDKLLTSLGYSKPSPQLLQTLGLLGGSTALGAGFGALRKPGGSRARGAVIGGTAGLLGGAGLMGANAFMDSPHMRNVKDTSWQAPTVLGTAAGATAGGVGLGRRLAALLGLRGHKNNDPNNDLEELDLTQKFNITPFG